MLNIKKARPMFSGILVTKDKYEKDELLNGVYSPLTMKGQIKLVQKVYAVGPFVKTMEPGNLVKLSLARYAVRKFDNGTDFEENSVKNDLMRSRIIDYDVPTEVIDGVEYMHIQENDVMLVIEDWDEIDTPDLIEVKPVILGLDE